MSNLFEVSDPKRYKVVCTKMAGWEAEIQNAIKSPYIGVYQDNDFKNRNVYYGLSGGKERYIKVVVEFQEQNYGEVITAFPTDSPKSGERLIWPKSKD